MRRNHVSRFSAATAAVLCALALIVAPAALAQDGQNGAKKKSGSSGGGTLVQVDAVRSVPMKQTLPLVGRLVAIRAGMVAARIDAPVAEMKVDIGDRVKKGELLALLAEQRFVHDRAQKAAELAAAEAAVATSEARLKLAEQELKRIGDLKTSSAFPKARFDDKRVEANRLRTEIVEAKAKVAKARAALAMTDTNLSYARIKAPYDGTITRRHTEMGAYVKEGQAIYTMVSDRALEVEVDVPASRIAALAPGMVCAFELGKGGKQYDATVRAIVPEEDPRTRTRTVRLTPNFGERPAAVAANQSATVHIPIGKGRDVVSVHKDALIPLRGQPTVFIVADGRAQLRTILIGDSVGARVEVLDGLKPGDIVVVRGNERLRDGNRVRYDEAAGQ